MSAANSAGANLNLSLHAYALDVSGYTLLPAQVVGAELDALRNSTDQALSAARSAKRSGQKLKFLSGGPYYEGARCMYCWGEACVRLLEHDAIHGLAGLLMKEYLLWDACALSALPTPASVASATTAWHRDSTGLPWGTRTHGYLWFFLCLDDMTPENGATWVVPGSHRVYSPHEPELKRTWTADDLEAFPSRIQVCARAGDLVVLDPTLLHTSGRNSTQHPRRILNIGICHVDMQPLLNHWVIAGPHIQEHASARLRSLLRANHKPLETTWTVLPQGWPSTAPQLQESAS